MTHVVSDACIKCRYTDSMEVCPVDCFRQGPDFVLIDLAERIACAFCISQCPVNAILVKECMPAACLAPFVKINKGLAHGLQTH